MAVCYFGGHQKTMCASKALVALLFDVFIVTLILLGTTPPTPRDALICVLLLCFLWLLQDCGAAMWQFIFVDFVHFTFMVVALIAVACMNNDETTDPNSNAMVSLQAKKETTTSSTPGFWNTLCGWFTPSPNQPSKTQVPGHNVAGVGAPAPKSAEQKAPKSAEQKATEAAELVKITNEVKRQNPNGSPHLLATKVKKVMRYNAAAVAFHAKYAQPLEHY
jgi:hypothetical protein